MFLIEYFKIVNGGLYMSVKVVDVVRCLSISMVGVMFLISSCVQLPVDEDKKEVEPKTEDSTKLCKLIIGLDAESLKNAITIVEENLQIDNIAKGSEDYYGNKVALDTSNYLLKIVDNKANTIYDGLYVNRPKEFLVKSGDYTISLLSGEFVEPQVSVPLFGDTKKIKAKTDSIIQINLVSTQMTGGLRVSCTNNFINYFRGSGLYYVKDTIQYKRSYPGNNQYVFFYPGEVKVIYKNKDGSEYYTPYDKPTYKDTLILSRKLKANDLVTIKLDYDLSAINTGAFKIAVDTNRNRYFNIHNVAFFAPYGSVSVVYAKTHIGDTVSLYGYIVGGDASTSSFSKRGPFTSKTHIVVAKENWQSLRENVMAVELPNGLIRKELNLVDNPQMVQKKIVIDGVIVDSYFGKPGLKSVTSYKLYK